MSKRELTKEDKHMLRRMFLYSFEMEHSYNYERQQGLGYSLAMWPAIKRFYKSKKEQGEALERHMAVFNATPQIETLIMGISAAMEREASENPDFDKSSINSVKIGLMGPFSGIGDSIFWGTLRIIATGIGLSLASQGNILGPILFLLIFNIPHLIIKYLCTFWGYQFGTDLMGNARSSGLLDKISRAATIVGLMVVGAMSADMVKLSFAYEFTIKENVFALQSYIDQIFPLLLPLCYTLFMFYLLTKKVKPTTLLLASIAIAILGSVAGLL